VDYTTLLIPDRPGNNRIDSLSNIAENPEVALIFFVPGMNETLRINGTATITHDQALLAPLAVQGRAPRTGVIVRVREAYLHCAKALMRSKLWDPATQISRKEFPSLARIVSDQTGGGFDIAAAEARTEESYQTRMY
jgi:PPOX class probable FMN-dependent enzyme